MSANARRIPLGHGAGLRRNANALSEDVIDVVPELKAKERRCLSCEGSFTSQWAGERICKTCKQTSSWRTGVAPKAFGTR